MTNPFQEHAIRHADVVPSTSLNWRDRFPHLLAALAVSLGAATLKAAEVPTFGGNSQHTSLYVTGGQQLKRIRWSADIDFNNSGQFAHYGAPLVTAANTVIAPVKTAVNGFQVLALNGATGATKYTLTTDYILPAASWLPVYQPVFTAGPNGPRLYYPGAGGTLLHVDNADSDTPGAPVQEVFYTSLANYSGAAAGFNSTIFINTPLTAGADGTVYFGFRVQGTAPAPLNTTQSGFARIDAAGNATYVLASTAANDPAMARDSHNSAPALSADGSTLFVVVKPAGSDYGGYLLGLNSANLAPKYRVFLQDPRNNNPAGILDLSTASPMVAPDGDVYLGVFGNPGNGSRGFLLRFNSDLTVAKTPGAFGWDYTPAVVPASMVPSYTGSSSYLLFAKYNNYAFQDGDGVNRIAILDPNATQTDPHTSAPGLVEMREVLTVIGPTRDDEQPAIPLAVREWCINAPAVDAANQSVLMPSEDGHIYRWNLAANSLTEALPLSAGVGQPYVPTTIAPDGTVYTLNGGTLFAIGAEANLNLTLDSSAPDLRYTVAGDAVTFTATLTGFGPNPPTGTITFTGETRDGLNPVTTVLAADVPLDATGHATVTTSALTAGGGFLGNHFVSATYHGDANYAAATVLRVQKIHAEGTTTTLASANPAVFGQSVDLTATVSSPVGVPTGMVTFFEGTSVLGQRPLNGSGNCTLSVTGLPAGIHNLRAVYASDTLYAASTGLLSLPVQSGTQTALVSSANPLAYGLSTVFTATVSVTQSGAGIPTGTVTFTDGGTSLGTVSLDGAGRGSLTVATLSPGSHSVTATFTGTGGWGNSSSAAITQNVTDGTVTAITSSPNPSAYSQSVIFSATVTSAHAGAGIPSGNVTFKEGAATLGTVTVNGAGLANLNVATLSTGSHVITATFTGTGGWGNSSSTAAPQNVTDGTTTTVSGSPNPANIGQTVTLVATVHAAHTGSGSPSGSVTFNTGTTVLGTVALNAAGQASLSLSTLTVGNKIISASFVGSSGWGNSSGTFTQSVLSDTTPPSIPTGVTATSGAAKRAITLHWNASTDASGIGRYEVYRATSQNGAYSLITSTSATTTTYVDNLSSSGLVRWYYIIAVDIYGNRSGASAKVQARSR